MDLIARLARVRTPGVAGLMGYAAHRGLLGRGFARILPIEQAADCESGLLYESAPPVCMVPREVGDPSHRSESLPTLAVRWSRLRNACIDKYSSIVLRGSEAYLQSAAMPLIESGANYSAGFCRHSSLTAHVSRDVAEHLERGIAICGCGAFNWYHWLVEVLPKAVFAKGLPDCFANWPLIVPPEAAAIPQFAESLGPVAEGRPIHIVKGGPVRVRDLIWIDSPSISPFNMTHGWPVPRLSFNHQPALADLAHALASSAQRGGVGLPKRVLLVRSDGRREYNQPEVVSMAAEFGFQPVSPELLTLSEQIALFRNADFFVGPSGAAWTGLLFAKAGGRGLLWVAEQYRGLNVFANLAAQQRFDLRYFFHRLSVRTTSEAYGAAYALDVAMLRSALKKVLSE